MAVPAAAVNVAAIHFLRRLVREDAASDVGPAQLSALSVLIFGGPHRVSDLGDAERIAVPTMSRVVTGLELRGLVPRGIRALTPRERDVLAQAADLMERLART